MAQFEKAKWIGAKNGGFSTGIKCPAVELRKNFLLDKMPKNAECLISGLGFFTLYINGKRVSEDFLSPAFTAYDKRALFVRYDVKELLTIGENVIAIKVGAGFLNDATTNAWDFAKAPWRSSEKLLFELFLDGVSCVHSDTDWRIREGATTHTSVRCGEYFDARLEDGWRGVDYDDGGWRMASYVSEPGGVISEMKLPPERICQSLKPQSKWRTESGWIYDFGYNITGFVEISGEYPCGTEIVMQHSERVVGGELYMDDIDCYIFDENKEFATDKYIFAGRGRECWHPEFVFHGFRYTEVKWDCDTAPDLDLTAHFVHTALDKIGDFSTSDELMNWIYDAGVRSFLSNYHGHPLDCPHREKNGWTGDANISCDYAVYLYDMKAPFEKWLLDMSDAQRPSGQLPGIVPTGGWGFNWGAGPAWDFALFNLPYVYYVESGDCEPLISALDTAEKYLAYAKRKEDAQGLVCYGLSDWCPPRNLGEIDIADNRLSDSLYYMQMHRITSVAYSLSGDEEKSRIHKEKAEEIRGAINRVFIDGTSPESFCQGALAMLLYFDALDKDTAQSFADCLAERMRKDNYVQKVGILGMKALPNALTKYGYTDVAYKILSRTDYPSYGYWKSLGETTLCELWEENQSRNHHMYSDAVNWIIRNIGGIKNCGIGYDKVCFEPYLFDENCSAKSSKMTRHGKISIEWERCGERFTADITLPDTCIGELALFGKRFPVKSGRIVVSV